MAEGGDTVKSGGKKGGPMGILILIIVLIVTAALMLATYSAYVDYTGEKRSVMEIKLKLTHGELDPNLDRWIVQTQNYAPYIYNISSDVYLSQGLMDALEAPDDGTYSLADRPAVVVYAFNTNKSWTSGKASLHYTGPRDYEFLIGFPVEPEAGDNIKIVFEVVYDKSIFPGEDVFPLYGSDQSSIFYVWQEHSPDQ